MQGQGEGKEDQHSEIVQSEDDVDFEPQTSFAYVESIFFKNLKKQGVADDYLKNET